MENVVAARRLRKSMLKQVEKKPTFSTLDDIGIPNDIYTHSHSHSIDDILSTEENVDGKTKKKLMSFKTKLIIKTFCAVVILFGCLICKLFFADTLKANKYVKILITQYKTDYSKEQIIEKTESLIEKGYKAAKYIIPESLANTVKNSYIANIKPKIVNFDLKNSVLAVMSPAKKQETENEKIPVNEPEQQEVVPTESNQDEQLDGKGGGEPIDEVETQQVSSAISIMQEDINTILSKKIDIKQPVTGTITSTYGAREQIFDEVNPYHTGVDIANVLNTPIHSATQGIVTKVQQNDKYYGNNVEVTTDGVVFKYAHMNSINVKQGENVNHGSILGFMGSTGMSTGSHMHWEIKIDSRTVDPQQIIKLN